MNFIFIEFKHASQLQLQDISVQDITATGYQYLNT